MLKKKKQIQKEINKKYGMYACVCVHGVRLGESNDINTDTIKHS